MKTKLASILAMLLCIALLMVPLASFDDGGSSVETTEKPADTSAPDTSAPDTDSPATGAPETSAPETNAPETNAPDTSVPDTNAPETSAPVTSTPDTDTPETSAPTTEDKPVIVDKAGWENMLSDKNFENYTLTMEGRMTVTQDGQNQGTSDVREVMKITAEKVEIIASFGGFAPADNPKVAVLVMVDEPQYLKSGGGVAAPAARKILKDILPYLGIEPNYTEAEIANLDRSTPNVVGSTLGAAATTLKASTLTYHVVGSGDTVVQQYPAAGTTIPQGGAVWLYTANTDTQMTTVPDFTRRSVAQVNQAATRAGVNVLLSGIRTTTGGTATSSKQSVTPGTKVPKGTVITVEFTYTDNIH
jgi:hypothetical protein